MGFRVDLEALEKRKTPLSPAGNRTSLSVYNNIPLTDLAGI
jgi:hypothetical protein